MNDAYSLGENIIKYRKKKVVISFQYVRIYFGSWAKLDFNLRN